MVKAKATTFIAQGSLTVITYDCHKMFIAQAAEELYTFEQLKVSMKQILWKLQFFSLDVTTWLDFLLPLVSA